MANMPPLMDVLQMNLDKYLDELMEISSQASKEYALEKVRTTPFLRGHSILLLGQYAVNS